MNYKQTLLSALKSAWIIIKLIIPIYILAEVLYFYNLLSYVSFLVEPLTTLLDLPKEAALSIISGMFLNLYAAIAFAAPLDLTARQWTILAVFLGICHALIVETAVMKKLGISNIYSISLRVIGGFIVAFLVTLLPKEVFSDVISKATVEPRVYENLMDVLTTSFMNSIDLTIKIIILISIIIFIMDFIKTRKFIVESKKNISKNFSLMVGVFLGITYGAGLLIKEAQNSSLSKRDIFYVGTFLMICHAIIEDTLLFVIFDANLTIIVVARVVFAIIFSYILLKAYDMAQKEKLD
ncbi:nucleoside recognition domain-containing protein [Arcobacter roscoffensis]|uniref:Nucleoside recognition protein n=1 Tax=Arcobacter roscoffensis TaxID=2961520 RepID=A0ABY5E3Y5_9BACT|nr:nucleoside recognition domain-containing protein [Arcobacter roscoffensis]UTJ05453.1 nucleoside recognition protein [Arcobacter roscoffensis]